MVPQLALGLSTPGAEVVETGAVRTPSCHCCRTQSHGKYTGRNETRIHTMTNVSCD